MGMGMGREVVGWEAGPTPLPGCGRRLDKYNRWAERFRAGWHPCLFAEKFFRLFSPLSEFPVSFRSKPGEWAHFALAGNFSVWYLFVTGFTWFG